MESAVDDREEGTLNADSADRNVQLMIEKVEVNADSPDWKVQLMIVKVYR